jgi:phosphatidylserine/phosphatidylglycerophosphate/cardiolipin synthase-like enzyme
VIESKYLAQNYEKEFQELWQGEFGKGSRTKNQVIQLNNITIENYFCPDDWCANKLIYALHNATNSIYFMTFSFTHDSIGEKIIEKFDEGIEVKGIFEKSQRSKYSEFEKLNSTGINVKFDNNPYNMHHKVFIIDNRTVITGSFNPTKNGDTRNDENMLIIHNKKIAKEYLEEFDYVWD